MATSKRAEPCFKKNDPDRRPPGLVQRPALILCGFPKTAVSSAISLVSFLARAREVPTRKRPCSTAPQSGAILPAFMCLSTSSRIGPLYLYDCEEKSVYNGLQWCNTEQSTVQSTATPGLTRGSSFCLCPRTRGIHLPSNQFQSFFSAAHFPPRPSCWATGLANASLPDMQLIGHALQFLRAWRLASGKPHLRARCRNRRYMHLALFLSMSLMFSCTAAAAEAR